MTRLLCVVDCGMAGGWDGIENELISSYCTVRWAAFFLTSKHCNNEIIISGDAGAEVQKAE